MKKNEHTEMDADSKINLSEENLEQPEWCSYPEATTPFFGCWSLLDGMVKNRNYCKNCDCYIKNKEK